MRFSRPNRDGYSLVELLVVIGILAVFVGLLLPAVQQVRATAGRMNCGNNLRQQTMALSSYHAAVGRLPSGKAAHSSHSEPYPDVSWLARLLPYVEHDSLWRIAEHAYRTQPDWATRPTPHPVDVVVGAYVCPADDRLRQPNLARQKFLVASTSYVGVSGTTTPKANGTFYRGSSVRFTDMSDGTSSTVVIAERPPSADYWYGWWYAGLGADGSGKGDMLLGAKDGGGGSDIFTLGCDPLGFRPGDFKNYCHTMHFWSLHPGGGNFGFADGSVRFLRYSAASVLPALATRAGGESVSVD